MAASNRFRIVVRPGLTNDYPLLVEYHPQARVLIQPVVITQ